MKKKINSVEIQLDEKRIKKVADNAIKKKYPNAAQSQEPEISSNDIPYKRVENPFTYKKPEAPIYKKPD